MPGNREKFVAPCYLQNGTEQQATTLATVLKINDFATVQLVGQKCTNE
jgi:hypothetical protein